jgi:uncharacterized protein involved in tellurium resistance
MQAQKAFDSPRHTKRGTAADLFDRLNLRWPKGGTASPPKRNSTLRLNSQDTRGGGLLALTIGYKSLIQNCLEGGYMTLYVRFLPLLADLESQFPVKCGQ